MEDFKRALCDGMHGALVVAQENDTDLLVTRTLVFRIIGLWFEDHPGLEDHTVKCNSCYIPTTKTNHIESSNNSDTPKYLCKRCYNNTVNPVEVQRELSYGLFGYLGV